MSAEQDKPEKMRRRWVQFSLRTLLVAMLLLAVGLGWLQVKMEHTQRQREAVAELERIGWRVRFEYAGKLRQPQGPKWLRSLLGEHFWTRPSDVWVIDSRGTGIVNATVLGHLKILDQVDFLRVSPMSNVNVEQVNQELPGCFVLEVGSFQRLSAGAAD